MFFLNIYIERQHANKKVLLKKYVEKHVLSDKKYYNLFLHYNQILVLVETTISLMVLFLHIYIFNMSSLY